MSKRSSFARESLCSKFKCSGDGDIHPETVGTHFAVRSVRYIFVFMSFIGYCIIFALRVNLSVAIVAMVNGTADVHHGDGMTVASPNDNECRPANTTQGELVEDDRDEKRLQVGEFAWSPQVQGIVLGAFYYGYCLTQIPGGRLAEIYGGKIVFGVGILICSLLNILTPIAARSSLVFMIAIRAALGLAQGVTMPAMHSMLGRWLPDPEKVFLTSIVYNGIGVGTLAGMTISGVLCDSELFGGWPSAFYVFGLAGCLWFVLWMVTVADTPSKHHFITREELAYIKSNQTVESDKRLPPIPWMKIFRSTPFWALVATQFGHNWYFATLLVDLPTFMDTILKIGIRMNGFMSAMPYFLQMISSIIGAFVADITIEKKICSTEFSRKFYNTIGNLTVVAGLVMLCFMDCNWDAVRMTSFMALVGLGGLAECGYMMNHLDLSPEYAGTLMGIANCIGELSGFISPAVVGALVQEEQSRQQWAFVFIISAVIALVTSIIFLFFGTTKNQNWISEAEQEPNIT